MRNVKFEGDAYSNTNVMSGHMNRQTDELALIFKIAISSHHTSNKKKSEPFTSKWML